MRLLILILFLSGCATTPKPTFCDQVNKAEKEYDFDQMTKILALHLKENQIPDTKEDRTKFLFSELRKCGYDISE